METHRRSPLIPLDTTLDAARVYFHTLKKLGPQRRLEMAATLTRGVRRRIEAGVRRRHPEYSDDEVRREVLRALVGERLARECRARLAETR